MMKNIKAKSLKHSSLVQVLDGDVVHSLDAVFVDELDLETGQIDDQPLLDFLHTGSQEVVGFVHRHI